MSNNNNDSSNSSQSPSFLGWLTLIFITLKLTGYIDWSWWWVTAPIWGQIVIALVLIVIGAFMIKQ